MTKSTLGGALDLPDLAIGYNLDFVNSIGLLRYFPVEDIAFAELFADLL